MQVFRLGRRYDEALAAGAEGIDLRADVTCNLQWLTGQTQAL